MTSMYKIYFHALFSTYSISDTKLLHIAQIWLFAQNYNVDPITDDCNIYVDYTIRFHAVL